MEEKNNTETVVENKDGDGTVDKKNTETTANQTTVGSLTISKADYDKAIQSAEDKVRGKLSKTIKELEAKVSELSPVEKTQEQIELENRIAALEASEKVVAEQKQKLDMQEQLSAKGLEKSLVDYMKEGVDVETLSTLIDDIVKNRMKSTGYVPGDHTSDEKVTPEDFQKMSYSQRVELSQKHPETYKRFTGRK